ncbi:hypothetical protein F5Y16DRAFT_422331 [Xylariaceae sp. FL0255]|nr:hypothetical protein F5Y16DRAFT_422331 [Xylariaceae sp. FL0255]
MSEAQQLATFEADGKSESQSAQPPVLPNIAQEFAWYTCENDDDAQRRIYIKEAAAKTAIEQCQKLIDELEASFAQMNNMDNAFAHSIWPKDSREQWLEKSKSIMKDHRKFNVMVGVSGPTGSGKTSTLNSLLGYNEVLPSSNEQAATAVPCKISYNDSEDPKSAFRCRVHFRSLKGFRAQLNEFTEDMQELRDLQAIPFRTPEDGDALRNLEKALKPTFELFKAVFHLDRQEAESIEVDQLLTSHPKIVSLLGTVREKRSESADGIAEQAKSYMDSTPVDHDGSSTSFQVWPLIDKVELFVKSDILKNGVVLLDLPGSADAVESRAAVADRYFARLTATLLVMEAHRSISTTANADLMSKHQQMIMMLNGKFNKQSLAVCISKVDEISIAAALKGTEEKSNPQIQSLKGEETVTKARLVQSKADLKEGKKAFNKATKESTTAERDLSKFQNPKKKKKKVEKKKITRAKKAAKAAQAKLRKQTGIVTNLERQVQTYNMDLQNFNNKIYFLCIKMRNSRIEKMIQTFLASNHKELARNNTEMEKIYDGTVSVIPVSSTAFWAVQKKEQMPGFPEENYTGIPELAQWIRRATIAKREEHVNGILSRLHDQFNLVQLWSKSERGRSRIKFNREDFDTHVMAIVFKILEQALDDYWDIFYQKIDAKNPMNNNNRAFDECAKECVKVVEDWSYLNDRENSADKVHWQTYKANITKRGSRFISKTASCRQTYNWMADICHVFLRTIVNQWNTSLNHEIPALVDEAIIQTDKIWAQFLQRLGIATGKFNDKVCQDIRGEMPALNAIKCEVQNKVREVVDGISERASRTHPDFVKVIQQQWEPAFKDAQKASGLGSHSVRQTTLKHFANNSTEKVFNEVFKEMRKQLGLSFRKLPKQLHDITPMAIDGVRGHINVLLDKIIEPDGNPVKLEEIAKLKEEMQNQVQSILLEWDLKWKVPETTYDPMLGSDRAKIPQVCRDLKAEALSDDDDEEEGSDTAMKDADNDADDDNGDSDSDISISSDLD